MKTQAKNSKDKPLYLLHHDLARTTKQNEFKLVLPKPERATYKQLPPERTRLCCKRVGRLVSRGEKPTEPGDSWLPVK